MLLSAVSSSSSCPSSLCALQTSAARILSRPKGPLSPTSYCVFSNERQGPDGFPPVAAGFAMLTRLCSNLVGGRKPGSRSAHGGQAAFLS